MRARMFTAGERNCRRGEGDKKESVVLDQHGRCRCGDTHTWASTWECVFTCIGDMHMSIHTGVCIHMHRWRIHVSIHRVSVCMHMWCTHMNIHTGVHVHVQRSVDEYVAWISVCTVNTLSSASKRPWSSGTQQPWVYLEPRSGFLNIICQQKKPGFFGEEVESRALTGKIQDDPGK